MDSVLGLFFLLLKPAAVANRHGIETVVVCYWWSWLARERCVLCRRAIHYLQRRAANALPDAPLAIELERQRKQRPHYLRGSGLRQRYQAVWYGASGAMAILAVTLISCMMTGHSAIIAIHAAHRNGC